MAGFWVAMSSTLTCFLFLQNFVKKEKKNYLTKPKSVPRLERQRFSSVTSHYSCASQKSHPLITEMMVDLKVLSDKSAILFY